MECKRVRSSKLVPTMYLRSYLQMISYPVLCYITLKFDFSFFFWFFHLGPQKEKKYFWICSLELEVSDFILSQLPTYNLYQDKTNFVVF